MMLRFMIRLSWQASLLTSLFVLISPQSPFAFDIILDPGHSVKSKGATSCSGVPEYIFNDYLTRNISERLNSLANIKIYLTREESEERSLSQRTSMSEGKDLFLSIHHDSVNKIYIQKTAFSGITHNCSSNFRGFSLFVSKKNQSYRQSLEFATLLGKSLIKRGFRPSLHHAEAIKGENRTLLDPELGIYQFDDLIVLKNSKAPAVLFEAGIIVNPEEEVSMRSDSTKYLIADAVYEALKTFHGTGNVIARHDKEGR